MLVVLLVDCIVGSIARKGTGSWTPTWLVEVVLV